MSFDLSVARSAVGGLVRRKMVEAGVLPWRPVVARPSVLSDIPDDGGTDALWVLMGKDGAGVSRWECLDQMPHLLVAGTTGSGKSVFLNGLLASLLVRHTPGSLLLGIIDPKVVEFAAYDRLPHLQGRGVATDMAGAIDLMSWAVALMEERLWLFRGVGVKSLADYNKTAEKILPRVVLVIDEFADLIMGADRKSGLMFKEMLTRLAQKARAAGVHLVLATQKPIVKVVDSLLKGNIPARVAFRVTNEVESRVILDRKGAEMLAGRGDMLFQSPVVNGVERMRGAWLDDDTIRAVVRGG